MMSQPYMSVIICTYNRSNQLHNVLENLKNQAFTHGNFRWELVLVDNNSVDGTRELVESWIEERPFPIKYIFEPQQGKSFALNSGVKAAEGTLLAFTDDDVILDRNWLSAGYYASKNYQHNIIGGKTLPLLQGALPSWLTEDKRYAIYGGPFVKEDHGSKIKEYDETMFVPGGCNLFIRKDLFHKCGHFNTRLGHYSKETLIYGEDTELMFRFKNNGESILYYPHAIVHHPVPTERLKKSYFRKYYWGSGRGRSRWLDLPPGTVRYLNIPRYLIRKSLQQLTRLIFALPTANEYKKFYHELNFLYTLGMICEFYIEAN